MPVREASRLGQLFIVKKTPVRLRTLLAQACSLCPVFTEVEARGANRTGNYSYNTKKKEIVRGDPPPHLRQFSSLLKRKKMPVWLHTSVGYYNYFCTFAPEIEFYYRAHP